MYQQMIRCSLVVVFAFGTGAHAAMINAFDEGRVSVTNGTATADHGAAATLVQSVTTASVAAGTKLIYDVTSAVQADAAVSQTYSAFRFSLPSGAVQAGSADVWNFGAQNAFPSSDAILRVVPEPASVMLLRTGGMLMLVGTRNKDQDQAGTGYPSCQRFERPIRLVEADRAGDDRATSM